MKRQLPFIYLECQNCKEKIHCDRCEAVLTETVGQFPGIDRVEIHLAAKMLFLESNLDPDVIEGALEDAGIFVK